MLPEEQLIFVALLALVVVGPKDLPLLLRKVGQFTARMRGLAGEFRASFDEMARQSELDELRREVEALREGRIGEEAKPAMDGSSVDLHAGLRFDTPTAEAAALTDPAPAAEPSQAAAPATASEPSPSPSPEVVHAASEPARAEAAH